MNRILLITILMLFTQLIGKAQNFADAESGVRSENSGTAKAAGSNLYSVDMFTGTANVTIPLYSYNLCGLNLGVSLSYDTHGLKVDDISSYVGLGWTLNTGGLITRETHGIEDELTENFIDTISASGHSGRACDTLRGALAVDTDAHYPSYDYKNTEFSNRAPDREWDVFTAVLGGRTVKFSIENTHMTSSGTYKVHFSPNVGMSLDIFINDTSLSSGFYSMSEVPPYVEANNISNVLRFVITDEHGNRFFFDRGDYQAREYRYKTFHPVTQTSFDMYYVPSSWVLTKVITYRGDVVKYTYAADDNYSFPCYRNLLVQETDFNNTLCPSHPQVGNLEVIDDTMEMFMYTKRLVRIDYPNGDAVIFTPGSAPRLDRYGGGAAIFNNRPIGNITVQNGFEPSIMNSYQYVFNYVYRYTTVELNYPDPGTTIPDPYYSLRLMLKSIDKVGLDNTTIDRYYTFGYEPGALPDRLSGFTDCYGYYNGASETISIFSLSPDPGGSIHDHYAALTAQLSNTRIPYHTFSFKDANGINVTCSYGRDMTPHWDYTKIGLLKTITNGTEGTVTFDYKAHALSNAPDYSSLAWVSSSDDPRVYTGYFNSEDLRHANMGGAVTNPAHLELGSLPKNYFPPSDLTYRDADDGVCIDKITLTDSFSSDNTRIETYNFSDGMRFYGGGYFWYSVIMSDFYAISIGPGGSPADAPFPLSKIYQTSFTNMDLFNGFNHGYSTASVTTTGYAGEFLGKTKYAFTNLIAPGDATEMVNGHPDWGSRLQVFCSAYSHLVDRKYFRTQMLGLIKAEETFDAGGNVLTRKTNLYNEICHDTVENDSRITIQSTASDCPHASSTWSTVHNYFYRMFGSNVQCYHSDFTTFSGSQQMTVSHDYKYCSDGALGSDTYINSRGEQIKDSLSYWRQSSTAYLDVAAGMPPPLTTRVQGRTARFLLGHHILLDGYTTSATLMNVTITDEKYKYYDGSGNIYPSPTPPPSTAPSPHPSLINLLSSNEYLRFDRLNVHNYSELYSSWYYVPYLAKHYTLYDDKINVIETKYNNDATCSSAIWDTRFGKKVADVKNALYSEIAYCSFEGTFLPSSSLDYNKGNWVFDPTKVHLSTGSTDKAVTGRYYYSYGTGGNISTLDTLASKMYVLSFWFKGPSPSVSYNSFAYDVQTQLTVGDWKFGTTYVNGVGTSAHLTITGASGTCIDELRLCPKNAAMTTLTFEPLVGVTSECDERGNIIYHEYDGRGNPKINRDIFGNIVSFTKTVIQGTDY